MAVCPAGEDVIGPYLRDRRGYVVTHLRPLRNRPEPVYVQSGTRAERVAARNPAKQVRYIDYKVGLASIDNTLRGLHHMFDGTRADLDGTTILCVIDDETATHERLLMYKALTRTAPSPSQARVGDPIDGYRRRNASGDGLPERVAESSRQAWQKCRRVSRSRRLVRPGPASRGALWGTVLIPVTVTAGGRAVSSCRPRRQEEQA